MQKLLKISYLLVFIFGVKILFASNVTEECEIQFHNHFVFDHKKYLGQIIKSTTCQQMPVTNIIEYLSDMEGEIKTNTILEKINTNSIKVKITPKLITITPINDFIRKKLNLGLEYKVSTKTNQNFKYLAYENESDYIAVCDNCDNAGNFHLKIEKQNTYAQKNNFWLQIEILRKITALKLNTDLRPFNSELNNEMILFEDIYVKNPEDYLKTTENITFYRTKSSLQKGSYLLHSNLVKKPLVKANQVITIILKSNNLEIKTSGISTQNAGIGEIIEVLNPKSKKKFLGNVIDKNLVKVEL